MAVTSSQELTVTELQQKSSTIYSFIFITGSQGVLHRYFSWIITSSRKSSEQACSYNLQGERRGRQLSECSLCKVACLAALWSVCTLSHRTVSRPVTPRHRPRPRRIPRSCTPQGSTRTTAPPAPPRRSPSPQSPEGRLRSRRLLPERDRPGRGLLCRDEAADAEAEPGREPAMQTAFPELGGELGGPGRGPGRQRCPPPPSPPQARLCP